MTDYEERTQRILEKAQAEKHRRKKIKIASVTAGALAAVLTLNLVLFVPYQTGGVNISKYKNSEYYSVISALSGLTYDDAVTTNNFTKWLGGLGTDSTPGDSEIAGGVPIDDGNGSGQTYREVTNNQTENVIEGDLIKRSDKFIYYLNFRTSVTDVIINERGEKETYSESAKYMLQIYSIAGENSELVATYELLPEGDMTFLGYTDQREMFLNESCDTITVLSPCYNTQSKVLYTALISLDVSDPNDIKENSRIYISGQYVSSRVADGTLLLVSDFSVRQYPDFSQEEQFLPQTGTLGSLSSLPVGDIVLPDAATSASYTVVCSLDYETLCVNDCVAFLSYSDEVYVSGENLFVTRTASRASALSDQSKTVYSYAATEICRVCYDGEGLRFASSYTVTGTVNDRYSLDEYEGVLRVFTTSSFQPVYTKDGYASADLSALTGNSANLYCIDLETGETLAAVERFCPAGESVKSARFAGDKAYVCTASVNYDVTVWIEDPVYAFDLSDYTDISYTDTGTIPGYSLSLITFTDGTLLGIGYGDDFNTLKIEVYRETDSQVIPLDEYTLEYVEFSDEFKAYLIDAEDGLVGLACNDFGYGESSYSYLLLRFDGYGLVEMLNVDLFESLLDFVRAVYIDGYLYLFGYDTFEVLAVA